MLIVALIGRDERERGNGAGAEVGVEAIPTVETDHVRQVAARLVAFLHAAKVDEGVVLGRVEEDDVGRRQRRRENRRDRAEIGEVAVEAVTVVYAVGALRRQAFLITFPRASRFRQLIGDRLARYVGGGRDGLNPVNVVYAGRAAGLIGRIDRGRRGIRPRAADGANDWAMKDCRWRRSPEARLVVQ